MPGWLLTERKVTSPFFSVQLSVGLSVTSWLPYLKLRVKDQIAGTTYLLCAHNAKIIFLSFFPPKAKGLKNLILVAMHHTFDKEYVLPQHRNTEGRGIQLFVECLFFENEGLLKCPRNKAARKKVCQEVITAIIIN